ncbi:triose-phosphate isomerase, partial [Candidatus Woesearchaeota archaeon]|nr:triose-phosphate isomerase [Candidatus Woesearchaeota archaeon]
MRFPAFLVNCKAYPRAVGKNAVRLAQKAERVAKKTGVKIILCVQAADIAHVAEHTSLPVFAQHVDVEPGAHTGNIEVESVIASGAKGTLLNHAERQLPFSVIKQTIKACKKFRLPVVLCAPTPAAARKLATLRPTAIAVEPPALIGTGVSVSKAKPSVITNSVNLPVPVLCGAGISDRKDVEIALSLGAKGILVASAVVLGSQERMLDMLARGFKP